jgi:hypothetical protein
MNSGYLAALHRTVRGARFLQLDYAFVSICACHPVVIPLSFRIGMRFWRNLSGYSEPARRGKRA